MKEFVITGDESEPAYCTVLASVCRPLVLGFDSDSNTYEVGVSYVGK